MKNDYIKLYPVPNDGNFSVTLLYPLVESSNKIQIINSAGITIHEDFMLKDENFKQFNLPYIKPGPYIFMITSKRIIAIKKFIKE